jgi:hypothetical protein
MIARVVCGPRTACWWPCYTVMSVMWLVLPVDSCRYLQSKISTRSERVLMDNATVAAALRCQHAQLWVSYHWNTLLQPTLFTASLSLVETRSPDNLLFFLSSEYALLPASVCFFDWNQSCWLPPFLCWVRSSRADCPPFFAGSDPVVLTDPLSLLGPIQSCWLTPFLHLVRSSPAVLPPFHSSIFGTKRTSSLPLALFSCFAVFLPLSLSRACFLTFFNMMLHIPK